MHPGELFPWYIMWRLQKAFRSNGWKTVGNFRIFVFIIFHWFPYYQRFLFGVPLVIFHYNSIPKCLWESRKNGKPYFMSIRRLPGKCDADFGDFYIISCSKTFQWYLSNKFSEIWRIICRMRKFASYKIMWRLKIEFFRIFRQNQEKCWTSYFLFSP